MADIEFVMPKEKSSIIKVLGIGGGGNNAVNHMYRAGIQDVNFIVCNTDHQALDSSPVPNKVQLGTSCTEGMGAGSQPEKGRTAALENLPDVMKSLGENTRMVFLATGMGGGTGTGATPVIAKACKEAGLLTIAVVTLPFKSEGGMRMKRAIAGIQELQNNVDSLLVINNDKLLDIYGNLSVSTAFAEADNILTVAVKGIAEIITTTGHVNVDFADVKTVMENSGVAIMGMGVASGEDRVHEAVEAALASPLLNANDITGAKSILININTGSGDSELTMGELGEMSEYLYEKAFTEAEIIMGLTIDETLEDKVSVTVVATGFKADNLLNPNKENKNIRVVSLNGTPELEPPNILTTRKGTINKSELKEEPTLFSEHENTHDVYQVKIPLMNTKKSITSDDIEGNMTEIRHQAMDNALKKEGLSVNTVSDYIDTFENIPAYLRQSRTLDMTTKISDQEPSVFTLSSDEEDNTPVISKNNAYLNDNVD